MDIQLDLHLEALGQMKDLTSFDFQDEYADLWGIFQPAKLLIKGTMFYRDDNKLWARQGFLRGALVHTLHSFALQGTTSN